MTGLYNLSSYKMKRGRSLFLLSALWSIILILQTGFLSSTTVLASPRVSVAAPTLGASQTVDFADVSVVRLVATYEPPAGGVAPTSATLAQCTGLGVMISSWTPVNGSDQNNWVLTDGNLVNPNQPSCSPTSASSNLTLLHVDLYFNTVFNPALLPAFQVPPNSVRCQLPTCRGGVALLSFATSSNQTFPHVDMASDNQTQNMALGLHLQNESKPIFSLPVPSNANVQLADQYLKEAQRYLTPQQEKPDNVRNPLEAGSPIFNQAGELTAIELSNKTSVPVSGFAPMINALPVGKFSSLQRANAIESVPTTPSTPSAILPVHNNAVYENWKTGIKSFYQGDYVAARVEFQKAEQGNALFETPFAFVQLINSHLSKIASHPTQPSSSITINIFGVQLTKNMLIALILSVLVVLIVLVAALLMHSRILRRRRILKDYAEAERQADMEAQRIKAVEGAQGQQHQWAPSSMAPAFSSGRIKTSPLSLTASVLCPYCGAVVKPDANFCSNCRMMLSPMGPAHHMRVMEPPMPPAQQAMPFTMPVVNSKSDVPVVPIQPPPVGDPPTSVPSPTPSISTWPVSDKPDGDSHPSKSFDNSVKEKAPHVANTGATPYIDQRLGNYRIKSLLGRGGFADVYLGEHVFLKTNAAVKVLHTRLTSGDLAKFLTEARTIASLSHPHIIRVLDFGLEGNEPDMDQSSFDMEGSIPFLIMDYAPGGTLRGRYPKGTRVPLSEIIHYVKQVAEALQYAHDRKLIYRDVKPENMLLSQNDELLLSDFGIVTVAHDDHSMSTQEMAGTVSYIAPEQIKGKPRPASDQYALAVVVYEWLCGIRPFQGNNQWEIMYQHQSLPPTPLRTRIASLPPAVDEVVLKALAKIPSQRFETISAFAAALEQAAK